MDCPTFDEFNLKSVYPIGSGTFGEVYLAVDNDSNTSAIKLIKDDNSIMPIELAVQSVIDNPYIIKITLLYQSDKINIAMPLAPIPLWKLLEENYTFHDRLSVMRKVLEGIACLHSNGISHNDIKPENILLRLVQRNNKVILEPYIIDFGLSFITRSMITGKLTSSIMGTIIYLPPEILTSFKNQSRVYNDKVDIWAYGMTLYYIFTGGIFFKKYDSTVDEAIGDIQRNLKDGSLSSAIWDGLRKQVGVTMQPRDAKMIHHLISMCLDIDPAKRPHAYQLLGNPVFRDIITPIEKCYFKSINLTPKDTQKAEISAKYIVKVVSKSPIVAGAPIGVMYHAVDISYMYFMFTDNTYDEGLYILSCICLAIRLHGFVLNSENLSTLLSFINSKRRPEDLEKLMIIIIKTLSGKIWRKYIYESLRTHDDMIKSINILYNARDYYNFVPNPVNPITYSEPEYMRDMKICQLLK